MDKFYFNKLIENIDLWNLYTRKEEYESNKLDNHERFIYKFSKEKDLYIPRVSEYLYKNNLNYIYPDKKKFSIILTHDVDNVYPPLSHSLLSSLYYAKKLDVLSMINQFTWKLLGKNSPYMNFQEIRNLEKKYEAESTFFFMATDSDISRVRYDISSLENQLGLLVDSGTEIGLHVGYYSYLDTNKIIIEKRKIEKIINKKVIGCRNHYLRFKVPESWEVIKNAGLLYDTTMGYSDNIGFRNGMCYPFKPYNLNNQKLIDLLEIPLVIMDGTLVMLEKDIEKRWELIDKIINITEKLGGVLTILFHNDVFSCVFKKELFDLYIKILKTGYEKNAWMTSCSELYNWWINNNY